MITLGFRCAKDSMDWAVVNGDERYHAAVIEQEKVQVPVGSRGHQLAWARKEVLELLERHQVDAAAVRVAEAGGKSVSLGRSEVEGVVQEALESAGLSPVRHVAATIRGAYGAHNNVELGTALSAVSVIKDTAASRREPVVSAVALLPE